MRRAACCSPSSCGRGAGFELVTGERRWRAGRLLGWTDIPAIVRELTDEEAAALAMIGNLSAKASTRGGRAEGYRKLLERFNWTQGELARRVGKSQSTIANKLRLLRLPEPVQERVVRQALRSVTRGPCCAWRTRSCR